MEYSKLKNFIGGYLIRIQYDETFSELVDDYKREEIKESIAKLLIEIDDALKRVDEKGFRDELVDLFHGSNMFYEPDEFATLCDDVKEALKHTSD